MSCLVDGVTVDDAFIFAGGRDEFYREAGCEADVVGQREISAAKLQTANDMLALRRDFDKMQASHVVNLFGPETGRSATPEEVAVRDGMILICHCNIVV